MKVTSFRELMASRRTPPSDLGCASLVVERAASGRCRRRTSRRGNRRVGPHDQYNPKHVDEPMQEMFSNARVHNQDRSDLRRYREALGSSCTRTSTCSPPKGETTGRPRLISTEPGVRALEEGVSELYSQQALNDYIDEIGLEEIAPGIRESIGQGRTRSSCRRSETFAEAAGKWARRAREVASGWRWYRRTRSSPLVAETIYDKSACRAGAVGSAGGRRPADRGGDEQPFSEVDKVSDTEPQRRRESREGRRPGSRGRLSGVEAIQKQWTMPAPEMQVAPRSQESQQTRSTGTSSTKKRVVLKLPSLLQLRARSAELQNAMRAGLGGSAPLSGASRLGEGAQGARRGGVHQGHERQGAQRNRLNARSEQHLRPRECVLHGTLITLVPELIDSDRSSVEVLTRKALSHTFAALDAKEFPCETCRVD